MGGAAQRERVGERLAAGDEDAGAPVGGRKVTSDRRGRPSQRSGGGDRRVPTDARGRELL